MPAEFDKCRSEGGRIRTVSGPNKKFGLKSGEYIHVCFKDGQMHEGEKKQEQKK